MITPTRTFFQEQEGFLSVVVKLQSQMSQMLGEMKIPYRIYDEELASSVKTNRDVIGWSEMTMEMSAKFIFGQDVCTDWIFEQIFSVKKEWFRYLRTELVQFQPDLGVSGNEKINFVKVPTDVFYCWFYLPYN